MLKQQAITALWLLPLMLGMLFYAPQWSWAAFSDLIALIALWEYARMSGLDKVKTNHYLTATLSFSIVAYAGSWELSDLVWYTVLASWLAMMPPWSNQKWKLSGGWQAYAAGRMLMVPFWSTLVSLRSDSDEALPLPAVIGLVWVAGTFAHFSDKAFGKHRLTPAISLGKNWEGVTGGALCVAVYVTLVRDARWLSFETGQLVTVGVELILTAVSACGDLLES